jgi:adenine-specific DNA-methyltransferase
MTELVWDGKYKDGKKQGPVRIALPFQTIETVNESAQDRQRNLELFSSGRETEWRNRLIWSDKKYVLPSLLPEFAGKVNLIYIDPPFDTGADFSFTATVPGHPDAPEDEAAFFTKEPSIIEQKAYRDTWGQGLDSYLHWFYEAVVLLRELLAEDGSIYIHIGQNISHYVKAVLDELFGASRYLNQIIWRRQTAHSDVAQGAEHLGRLHDVIFVYTKTESYKWQMQYTPYDKEYVEAFYRHVEPKTGRRYRLSDITAPGKSLKGNPRYEFLGITRYWRFSEKKMKELYDKGRILQTAPGTVPAQKRYLDEMPGVPLQDIWLDIKPIQSQAAERVGYDTQKPEALLERILKVGSDKGDLVLDCFAGSGTTAVVAEKLNRRWIACDLGRFAIHTTRKRLLGIPGVRPFVVQNLGKYERQAWQVAEFPASAKDQLEEQRQREAAYRRFVLDLYHATLITGRSWLYGSKGGRAVHVGAVDAPVTLSDVKAIAKETWKALGSGKDGPSKAGVDILGWEFAFELNELAKNVTAESRVDVSFKKIPREVLDKKAIEQGDVKFFELGALSVQTNQKGREVTLKLTEFVIPTDDIPEEVRKAIKHWSQLIDYWAVDWDYRNDTFHNQWQTYRTRQEPKIELETKHVYPEPGRYTIVVKVIDILGNDTTKTAEVTVK